MQKQGAAAAGDRRMTIGVEHRDKVIKRVRSAQQLMVKRVRPADRSIIVGVLRVVGPTIPRADRPPGQRAAGTGQTIRPPEPEFEPKCAARRGAVAFFFSLYKPATADRAAELSAQELRLSLGRHHQIG